MGTEKYMVNLFLIIHCGKALLGVPWALSNGSSSTDANSSRRAPQWSRLSSCSLQRGLHGERRIGRKVWDEPGLGPGGLRGLESRGLLLMAYVRDGALLWFCVSVDPPCRKGIIIEDTASSWFGRDPFWVIWSPVLSSTHVIRWILSHTSNL